jgi:cellulose synthase/poly-beta-1,6-N-acetylglucosamine synthase-like glycosyltransferase
VNLLLTIYLLAAFGLAIHGFNYFVMAILYWRKRKDVTVPPAPGETPTVTVQLPIYDELYVVERLIDAAAELDWDRRRLQIQVLDDSDDETTLIAQARVEYHRKRGVDIVLVRRSDRSGFKAGALEEGMKSATGEYIAVFDADFVPPPDFLKKTVPHLVANPGWGLVQTRWGHLNANYSTLTRVQAMALDGHFVVEQSARQRNGLFMNFNGSAGVWRRTCIEDAGGWNGDTLSEDLDLSYRAQMRGWKFLFLPDVIAPAEIPPQIHALKRQQFRWAKGSTQCLVKLAPRLIASPRLSPQQRVEGLIHLSGYLMSPLMLILLVTSVPLIALDTRFPEVLVFLCFSTLGPAAAYALSQRALYPDWPSRLRYFGLLVLLGIGLAVNNSGAVFEALTGQENNFRRTPKFRLEDDEDSWDTKRYTLPFSWGAIGELALAAYALIGVFSAWHHDQIWAAPFLILYAAGFAFTGFLTLWHSRRSGEAADLMLQTPALHQA